MSFGLMVLIVLGLVVFEVVSSIDNAVINADILSGMDKQYRRWFLTWGMLFAVVIVRGLLPFVILWLVIPSHDWHEVLQLGFSNDPRLQEVLHSSSPILFMGGGIFLLFLFFHWLFLEQKQYGFVGEKFFYNQGVWFYAVVSILLCGIVWQAIHINSTLAFAAVVGSTVFFITHGFKQQAKKAEESLKGSHMSNISKLLYLEVIDTTFSIDGVLGSFAFTLSLPLILIGNGLGALVLRQLTITNISAIKKYIYLENGAMYAILVLGSVMVLNGFGANIPEWISPIVTITFILYFYFKSKQFAQSI